MVIRLDFTKLEVNLWKEFGVISGLSYWRIDLSREIREFVKFFVIFEWML